MNLKEQLYVCTLARCQTISKAAEELYLSPSALSVYISNLEKYLGIRLFDRTGKSFVLTSIGEEYVIRAEKMLEMKEEFDGLVEKALQKGHPPIRIGIQQRRAISVVPRTLKRFMEAYPQVEVIFRDGPQDVIAEMYRKGAIDFMIAIYRDELPDACYEEIAQEQVLVALPEHHPANAFAYEVPGDAYKHIDMIHLDRETFILPSPTQSMRCTANRIFEQAGIRPKQIIELRHFDIIMSMVNQEMGIGFNRLGYVKDMEHLKGVNYYLIGPDPYCSKLVLAYRKGRVISECEACLLQILKEEIRNNYRV
ncbi:MAG: LysR family transcriptional regulator [Lachnospiraceae bacterium]|nr:LysR family transcriptional regulator [Lachnospiraceae bacterium]